MAENKDGKLYQPKINPVRAVQWNKEGDHPLVKMKCECTDGKCAVCGHPFFDQPGFMRIRIAAGDWIVKDERGDHHVFSAAEFESSFEEMKAGASLHVNAGKTQAKWLSSTYAMNMMEGVIAWFQQNRLSRWAQDNQGAPQTMWEHQKFLMQHRDAMERFARGE